MDFKSSEIDYKPTPDDFDNYLPWACLQLMVPGLVVITRCTQHEYVNYQNTDRKIKKPKGKQGSRAEVGSDLSKEDKTNTQQQFNEEYSPCQKVINTKTTYDQNENLVQVKFENCKIIPCTVFKIMALILQFHPNCINLTINKGIDNNSLYEIIKIIAASNVTDLCLDDSMIKNAHYHILLEQLNSLRYLSLCRCNITDDEVEKIAGNITYPAPSSVTLTILNLASNRITDVGAKYIAIALRSNRQLYYLNISNNGITDEGAIPIFTSLAEFPLTTNEWKASKARISNHLKYKSKLITQFLRELKTMDSTTFRIKARKSKTIPTTKTSKKSEKELSKLNITSEIVSNSYETALYEKAKAMAEALVGEFKDPFLEKFTRNDKVYCTGNNRLCYLNIAYNNISLISIRQLHNVIFYQKGSRKKDNRGLINVNVDGNRLPITCKELARINDVLHSNMVLSLLDGKKKSQSNRK